jgi:hypothetical protein
MRIFDPNLIREWLRNLAKVDYWISPALRGFL